MKDEHGARLEEARFRLNRIGMGLAEMLGHDAALSTMATVLAAALVSLKGWPEAAAYLRKCADQLDRDAPPPAPWLN